MSTLKTAGDQNEAPKYTTFSLITTFYVGVGAVVVPHFGTKS